ncbi:hypothetical protein L9F63_027346, partial [Diploptera punctata]
IDDVIPRGEDWITTGVLRRELVSCASCSHGVEQARLRKCDECNKTQGPDTLKQKMEEEFKAMRLSFTEDSAGERSPLVQSTEATSNVNYNSRHDHKLPLQLKAAYGLGHVFNDISAAMWFSYTLLFLQTVIGMEPALSGAMLLIGQLADGMATPVVGVLADRIGSRKSWHITGSILVVITFPTLFAPC